MVYRNYFKKVLILILLIMMNFSAWAGIMSRPRKIYMIKTQHFDILFSEVSSNSAKKLADNIDDLYKKAKEQLPGSKDLRMPVVISPDSDKLSVEYTSSPYNRIVIFDGVPENIDTCYEDSLLGLFYHQIYLALSQTIMNPFFQFVSKVAGDSFLPISLVYLPFSFVEARAFLADSGVNMTSDQADFDGIYGRFNDRYFLHILSEAKYNGMFPNWLQAGTIRDISPGSEINEAAGSAFAAYLMQTYGVEKYVEFWNKCGEPHLLILRGIFKTVYGISLEDAWQGFEDAVPVPEVLEKTIELESKITKIFSFDKEGMFENLVASEYGLIWYDKIRHEVDILDWNSDVELRKLLFFANGVEKLTLSPEGRYLVVSFYGAYTRPELREDKIWIYDLEKRKFLRYNFKLREGVIFQDKNGNSILCGINVKDKVPKLEFYSLNLEKSKYSFIKDKTFSPGEYAYSLSYAGDGKVCYIRSKNNKKSINQYDLETGMEKSWVPVFGGEELNITNLRFMEINKIVNTEKIQEEQNFVEKGKNGHKVSGVYTFNFLAPNMCSFSRTGIVTINEDFEPKSVYYQDVDIIGGVENPVTYGGNLFFTSSRFYYNHIEYIPFEEFDFSQGKIVEKSVIPSVPVEQFEILNWTLGNYNVSKYNLFKYLIHCSFSPFMAIKELATTEKQSLWPSLGVTVVTQDDPYKNNKIMLSGSLGYAKLDFIKNLNPVRDDITDEKEKNVDDKKNISFGLSFENSSTPVDIRAGGLFKFNNQGQYNFSVKANTFWQVSTGMDFSTLNFSILSSYIASTDYYDRNLSENYPDLSGWPSFQNAYETGNVSFAMDFSNIHQYGISKYQERGFSVGARIDSFWNITEIKLLSQANQQNPKENSGITKPNQNIFKFTQAQLDRLYDENMLKVSQLNVALFGSVKIPMLNPLSMTHGLVLSVPTTISTELFDEIGTAVHINLESLLLGYESQNGLKPLYLFFSRLGLKFGYDLKLNYDTYKVLPDIRKQNNLWLVFSNIYVRDSIYLLFDMDFSVPVGMISRYQFNLNLKTEYYIRSKGFSLNLNFKVSF